MLFLALIPSAVATPPAPSCDVAWVARPGRLGPTGDAPPATVGTAHRVCLMTHEGEGWTGDPLFVVAAPSHDEGWTVVGETDDVGCATMCVGDDTWSLDVTSDPDGYAFIKGYGDHFGSGQMEVTAAEPGVYRLALHRRITRDWRLSLPFLR